jgi:hypothetical protein
MFDTPILGGCFSVHINRYFSIDNALINNDYSIINGASNDSTLFAFAIHNNHFKGTDKILIYSLDRVDLKETFLNIASNSNRRLQQEAHLNIQDSKRNYALLRFM